MAVLLCRGDGRPYITPPPPELCGLPKLIVQYQPVLHHSDYQGKLITTRSESVYACQEEPRETTWRKSRERHQQQLREFGFHSTSTEPYKDLGEVILDDSKLIMEGLGQEKEKTDPHIDEKQVSIPTLHDKVSSEYHNEKLLTLNQKVFQGNLRLDKMRKGKPLSVLMNEEENIKLNEETCPSKTHGGVSRHWLNSEDEQLSPILEDSATLRPIAASHEATALDMVDVSACVSNSTRASRSPSTNDQHSLKQGDDHSMPLGAPPGLKVTPDTLDDQKQEAVLVKFSAFSDSTLEHWHKMLCTMVWIFETMKADQPYLSKPFATCWHVRQHEIDPEVTRKNYQECFCIWNHLEKQIKIGIVGKSSIQSNSCDFLKVVLDVQHVKKLFEDVREERDKVVHEQLKAMDRDRMSGTKERLSSLSVTGNLHRDLRTMRKGVKIESTEMARKRLLINFEWFEQLSEVTPLLVKDNMYCHHLLNKLEALAEYIKYHTAKMSKMRLLAVLATLRPWELMFPSVDSAIRHIITSVIYIPEQEYKEWLGNHIEDQKTKGIDDVYAVSVEGHRLPVYKV